MLACIQHSPARSTRSGTLSTRSEEHTSELQSHHDLVCRLLLEKKKKEELVSAAHAIPAQSETNCFAAVDEVSITMDLTTAPLPALAAHVYKLNHDDLDIRYYET